MKAGREAYEVRGDDEHVFDAGFVAGLAYIRSERRTSAGNIRETRGGYRVEGGLPSPVHPPEPPADAATSARPCWSCSHCGPHPDSRQNWCASGCGSDYSRMEQVPMIPAMAEAKHFDEIQRLREALANLQDTAAWYVQCLRSVMAEVPVRGLAEAEAGWLGADSEACAALSSTSM